MGKNEKRSGNSILRLCFVGISIIFQVGWLLLLGLELNNYSTVISLGINLLTLFVVIKLYSKQTTAAMKMPWIIVILSFPVLGLCLFMLIVLFSDLGLAKRRIRKEHDIIRKKMTQEQDVLLRIRQEDSYAANICKYLSTVGNSPVYENTDVQYYAQAVDAFQAMKEALEKAESFIFMEYFIIADGSAFDELREILVRKVKQGVEVRLMYDDIGSIGYVNLHFAKKLNEEGIQCHVFNPALPILNLFMNHRDHRKITVIDGKIGFTGGFNLADEYFDRVKPYGKWKDTGVRLEGPAVKSMTAAFLEMWGCTQKEKDQYDQYLNVQCQPVVGSGFVQPYSDDPLDDEPLAENVYINLASCAKESLYFISPYLIITDEMQRVLTLAAKRGVDVRIITPGIPDKKTVYAVTRSYYAGLVQQGIRIYEYSPGFCHAKQCICDGKIVSIGTSNLDFRSLYHHFENNVLIYGNRAVKDIADDFEEMFLESEEVTQRYKTGRNAFLLLWQCVLRLFAPLM